MSNLKKIDAVVKKFSVFSALKLFSVFFSYKFIKVLKKTLNFSLTKNQLIRVPWNKNFFNNKLTKLVQKYCITIDIFCVFSCLKSVKGRKQLCVDIILGNHV